MKRVLCVVVTLGVLASSQAFAAGAYVGGFGGVSFLHDSDLTAPGYYDTTLKYDVGPALGAVGGYRFDEGFRVEGEMGYRYGKIDRASDALGSYPVTNASLSLWSFMGNVYYDIKTGSPISPFIGAGIGFVTGTFDDGWYESDDTVFGYQAIAGVSYAINTRINLDLSYRLQGSTDFSFYDGDLSYLSSSVVFGVRYHF